MRNKLCVIILLLTLTGCNAQTIPSEQPHTNWPTSSGNVARTNSVPTENGPKGAKLTEIWTFESVNQIYSEPIISEGQVYFLSDSLTCLDSKDGKSLWEKDFEGLSTEDNSSWPTSLSFNDGKLFINIINKLFCLNSKDGNELWQIEVPMIASPPLVLDKRVYITNSEYKMAPDDEFSNGRLFCFDADTGKKLWEHKLAYGTVGELIAGEGKIFVSFVSPITGDPILTIVDAATGKEFYYNRGGGFAYDQGILFGSEFDLRAFDTTKLEDKWYVGSDIFGEDFPFDHAIGSNKVIVSMTSQDNKKNSLICINELNGEVLWRIALTIPYLGLTICGNKVYLTKNTQRKDVTIDILDLQTGKEIDAFTLNDINNFLMQAIADEKIFITSTNKITCLGEK